MDDLIWKSQVFAWDFPQDRKQSANTHRKEKDMSSKNDEMILKTAKEIVVKFIEVGNISPTSFHDHFRNIYATVETAVNEAEERAARQGKAVK
jgi:hypothetical protein